jgi:hypothetical protein
LKKPFSIRAERFFGVEKERIAKKKVKLSL